jgi:hypothetical protein
VVEEERASKATPKLGSNGADLAEAGGVGRVGRQPLTSSERFTINSGADLNCLVMKLTRRVAAVAVQVLAESGTRWPAAQRRTLCRQWRRCRN